MKAIHLSLALALAGATLSQADVPTSVSPTKPAANIAFAVDYPVTSGLSIRWRGNPSQDADDTDAGAEFVLCGLRPGARLEALTVRIGQGQTGSLNPGALGLPLILDFYAVDPATSEYTSLFRETAILPTNAVQADYLTFDLRRKELALTNGTYAFLIGSNLEDAQVTAEPHRFRLAVQTSDTFPGTFEIRREGFFGVNPVLGAPDPALAPRCRPTCAGRKRGSRSSFSRPARPRPRRTSSGWSSHPPRAPSPCSINPCRA